MYLLPSLSIEYLSSYWKIEISHIDIYLFLMFKKSNQLNCMIFNLHLGINVLIFNLLIETN